MSEPTVAELYTGILVLIRAGALLMFIPPLGGEAVPSRVRILLAAMVAFLVAPLVPQPEVVPTQTLMLILASGKEVIVGLLMGFAVRLILYAVEFAGRVISHEMGLMMSQSFDPLSNSQSSTVGSLMFYFTVIFMFAMGAHHAALFAFVRSFEVIGIGLEMPGQASIAEAVRASRTVFSLGLRIAGPIIALNFLINLALAVLGKVAPKINVFMTSFAIRILASLWLIAGSSALIARYLYDSTSEAPELMLRFILPGG